MLIIIIVIIKIIMIIIINISIIIYIYICKTLNHPSAKIPPTGFAKRLAKRCLMCAGGSCHDVRQGCFILQELLWWVVWVSKIVLISHSIKTGMYIYMYVYIYTYLLIYTVNGWLMANWWLIDGWWIIHKLVHLWCLISVVPIKIHWWWV